MCLHIQHNKDFSPKQVACPASDQDEAQAQLLRLLGQPVGLWLPTTPLGLKEVWSLEDVFIVVYVFVSDTYSKLFGSPKYFRRSNNSTPAFSDAEILTIALVGELAQAPSRRAWWRQVWKNYRYLFPRLCDRTRYERRLGQLQGAVEALRRHLLFLLNADLSRLRVVDSFPLSVCHLQRYKSSREPFAYYATVGYCAAKKEYFYGFRVHLLTDAEGLVVGYTVTGGHVHDTKGLVFMLQDVSQVEGFLERWVVLGDKGYVGEELAHCLQEEFGAELLALRREYEREAGPGSYNELVGGARKIVETTISVLTEVFGANRTQTRSVKGLLHSLGLKITALTLGNYLNALMKEPVLQVASLVN